MAPRGMSPSWWPSSTKAVNAALQQPELNKRYKELGYDGGRACAQAGRARRQGRAMWATVTQGITVD